MTAEHPPMNLFVIDENCVERIEAAARRLFTERRLDGDAMRDLAQSLARVAREARGFALDGDRVPPGLAAASHVSTPAEPAAAPVIVDRRGDADILEHDGGLLVRRTDAATGRDAYTLEMYEAPRHLARVGRWRVHCVEVPTDLASSVETTLGVRAFAQAAETSGTTSRELRAKAASHHVGERVEALETLAAHFGWFVFDPDPLLLTRAEIAARWPTEFPLDADDTGATP